MNYKTEKNLHPTSSMIIFPVHKHFLLFHWCLIHSELTEQSEEQEKGIYVLVMKGQKRWHILF
jgi:hypothetical protein